MNHATHEPSILLLHDGELSDVAALLRELGAATTERRGPSAPEDAEQSWRLVLASARRALEIPTSILRSSSVRIAIVAGESRTVCRLLRRAEFEIVVRRPVHSAALRLLLLHALYRGPEKRRTKRVSVGAPVQLRAGLRRQRAILAEISERGCRLLSSQRVTVGQALSLLIPATLAGGRAFSVKGMVVRATPAQIGAPGVMTLEFDPLRGTLRDRVRALVAAHSGGPSALTRADSIADAPRTRVTPLPSEVVARALPTTTDRDAALAESDDGPEALAQEEDANAACEAPPVLDFETDLEAEPAALPRRLVPLSAEASRVVLARGLSRDGMRADPSPRLERGHELNLALHLDLGGPAMLVRAHVEPAAAVDPDQPAAGPWLRFADLAPADGERLDALLAGLSIFSGGDGPEHALVVCEILDTPRG